MKKIKIIAILAVSFVVFGATLFALAQSQNGNSLFLDSDQDGLTDQEEKTIGTDPQKADTDKDGYSDGKEVESGYNPLKPAPGDQLFPSAQPSLSTTDPTADQADSADSVPLSQLEQTDLLDAANDLSSDPNNPNLTNEMIGELLQLTNDKASTSEDFTNNPTFSAEDLAQVSQGALETVDITKDMPEIKDADLNILSPVDDEKFDEEEIIANQKTEIEKYLAEAAFILASNSPFPVDEPENLQSQLSTESMGFFSAFSSGDKTKVDSYVSKAQVGIDQMKKIAVPYVLRDIHKSTLQLALYTVNLKDEVSLNTTDPMKSLAAASSLQAVAQKAMEIQSQFSQVLKSYEIEFISFP